MERVKMFCLLACLVTQVHSLDPSAPSRNSVDETIFPLPKDDLKIIDGKDIVNVHIIMHTHDDLGWLETFESYFEGNSYGDVSAIYNNILEQLTDHPKRKFSTVEMGYFMKWYELLEGSDQQRVKSLIRSKNWEILNGGYAMNDEACTYYDHIINQFYTGHRWIREEFGYVPRAGWAIDPFGHSSGQADLLRQMGYNGFFVERIHYLDFKRRFDEHKMEFLWKPDSVEDKSIFSSVNSHKYGHPKEFECEAILCSSRIDEHTLKRFANATHIMSQSFASRQFLWHVGDDFTYSDIHSLNKTYRKIERLQEWFENNSEQKVRVNFSTVESYLWYVYQENKLLSRNLTTKTDDFYPYLDTKYSSWTGYFTSKPRLKGFIYDYGRYYNSLQNFFAKLFLRPSEPFTPTSPDSLKRYDDLSLAVEKELSMMTHHDAITGTERKRVAFDYISRVWKSFAPLEQVMP